MRSLWLPFLAALCLAASANASPGPVLRIPERIPGVYETPVVVPIYFTGNGDAISATIFSVDFDETCLSFDPSDDDPADGTPDDVVFTLPPQFSGFATYDASDTDGELDFVIADYGPPLAALPDGILVYLIFTPACQPDLVSILAPVRFSDAPPASFGDTGGQGVSGCTVDGSVEIGIPIFSDGFESGDASAWAVSP